MKKKNKEEWVFFLFICLFVLKKGLWEALENLFRRTREAVGTPKLGTGAKGRLETALKSTSYFDYWQLCNGNRLWNQWTCDTQRRSPQTKLNSRGSSCLLLLPSSFLSVLSFLQLCLCFSAFWWTVFTKFQDRMDRDACFISSTPRCNPFHFLVLVSGRRVKKLSSLTAAHPSLCWFYVI